MSAVKILLAVAAATALSASAQQPTPPPPTADASQSVKLPPPRKDGGRPLMAVLADRQSTRGIDSAKEINTQTLSNLLWAAHGVNRPDGKRTAPSAHDWREILIYVATKSGLQLYDADKNELTFVDSTDVRPQAGQQEFVKTAPVVLIFVADTARMKDASDADKATYAGIDTGYVSQNVYLFCASEGLATVAIGWFDKAVLTKAMKLPAERKVILTQPVGFPNAK